MSDPSNSSSLLIDLTLDQSIINPALAQTVIDLTDDNMGDADSSTLPRVSLQSKDHEELLDVIDELRSQGISRYIDLPQVIVCGDQSSGKSSVLEALSGLRFPTKDNLCTRFATELILRRGTVETATVSIVPDIGRTDEEKKILADFRAPSNVLDNFDTIIESAEKAMGIDSSKRSFSKDVLRVELSGPKQPHLTLVDLPGLFHAGNKLQSTQDAEAVRALVNSYMEKSRSIILAVVSAKNDYANQIVTKYARDLDPDGVRTLGIITKPDTLHAGSDSEKAFVDLAENKDVHFRLGWHVLKNRDYDTRNTTNEERDEAEELFFSKGIWPSLPPGNMGINTLKPKLSRVLKDQILTELPSLIQDVENGVKDCRGRLSRLGESRGNLNQQRTYLLRVSQRFTRLMEAATQGNYADPFFGSSSTAKGEAKRLRAVVQNALLAFTKEVNTKGHTYHIVDEAIVTDKNQQPRSISHEEMVEEVMTLMRRTRGCELPGTFNPLIIGELFHEQSKSWQAIVETYTEDLLDAVRRSLSLTLHDAADRTTASGVLQYTITPAMEAAKEELNTKIAEMLNHDRLVHPITFNHYFTDNMQKRRDEEWQRSMASKLEGFFGRNFNTTSEVWTSPFNPKLLLAALSKRTQADMDKYACSEAINCMQAYYDVAKKSMVDMFAKHCIEEQLMKKLPSMFSPEVALNLSDETIKSIAAETQASKAERSSSNKKLEALRKTLDILHRLRRHNPIDSTDGKRPSTEDQQSAPGAKRAKTEPA